MPGPDQLTRRAFLQSAALAWPAIALLPAACTQSSSCEFVAVDTRVPTRLLFPGAADATAATRLLDLGCADEAGDIVLRFSDGRTLHWDRERSFESQVARPGGKVGVDAVATKVIAAYTLERLGQMLRRARAADVLRSRSESGLNDDALRALVETSDALRRDFEEFQRQAVLDAVTVGAIHDLARAVDETDNNAHRVSWDAANRRFVLEASPMQKPGDEPR